MYARDFKGLISAMKKEDRYTFNKKDCETVFDIMRNENDFSIFIWNGCKILVTFSFDEAHMLEDEDQTFCRHVFFRKKNETVGHMNLREVGLKRMRVA